jgi:hypothetical protein
MSILAAHTLDLNDTAIFVEEAVGVSAKTSRYGIDYRTRTQRLYEPSQFSAAPPLSFTSHHSPFG